MADHSGPSLQLSDLIIIWWVTIYWHLQSGHKVTVHCRNTMGTKNMVSSSSVSDPLGINQSICKAEFMSLWCYSGRDRIDNLVNPTLIFLIFLLSWLSPSPQIRLFIWEIRPTLICYIWVISAYFSRPIHWYFFFFFGGGADTNPFSHSWYLLYPIVIAT